MNRKVFIPENLVCERLFPSFSGYCIIKQDFKERGYMSYFMGGFISGVFEP